jgi:hypothetical protein
MNRLVFGAAATLLALLFAPPLSGPVAAAPTAKGAPLLAYYYTWFDPDSWNRAKTDYPKLGRYSSADPKIVRQHIRQAKAAGIEGFIVSWKHSATNDKRLELLIDLAGKENFKLAMIYQGLNFQRAPLPVAQVARDFTIFRDRYAANPVFFKLGGKPLTIWSGTWKFSHADIAKATAPVRNSMLVLNTAKNLQDYKRVADVTDGDAYYWSSVNPASNPTYRSKLKEMSAAVHADHKYWIAPFAPGFDARMVGGTKQVDRKNGETLRTEYAVAQASSPDALGLISWNEFSENTHVEPSLKFGSRYLEVLGELKKTAVPEPIGVHSSNSEPSGSKPPGRARATKYTPTIAAIAFAAVLVVGAGALGARLRKKDKTHPTAPEDDKITTPGP